MKKKLLWMLVMAISCILRAEVDLGGTWSLNQWSGFKPLPKVEEKNGEFHISEVNGKYGFSMKSNKKLAAKSGDVVKFTARVKGQGEMFFQLQNYDENGKWTGVALAIARVGIPADWQEITLAVKVENSKQGMTAAVISTFGAKTGSVISIREMRVAVETGEFIGDCSFPRQWKVFAPVSGDLAAPLDVVPESLGGVSGESMALDNSIIRFNTLFKERKPKNCAWLYGEIEANTACDYTIGAGADYYMAMYVNGEKVIDTLAEGDGHDTPHFSNHVAKVKLKTGKNMIAIKFLSGSGVDPRISLGGAEELRNLSSVVTVTETFKRDDYETPGERSGSPRLIQGILTDGIESRTGQGVYASGSVISFPNEICKLPAGSGGKLFATGIRIHKFDENGSVRIMIGKSLALAISRTGNQSELKLTVEQDSKALKSTTMPLAALPADFVFAVSAGDYYANAASLQDSKLRALNGKIDLTKLGAFETGIAINGPEVTVDEYFTGLAVREVKSNTVPFKVELNDTFDPVKAGWKMIWNDEFNGDSVDWEKTWMNSPWNPVPKNRDLAYCRDGMLHIRCDFKKTSDEKKPFASRAVGLFSQKRFSYGYYEARVRFTKKPGWFAAFWMLDEGRNAFVGGGYELDIFEDYSTRSGKNVIANNFHITNGPSLKSYGYHFELPGSLDDFYVIGCKWTPFEVSHYLNGKLIKSSSRHSPYQSATYDAINHGFGTSTLYICLSSGTGSSGGLATEEFTEEFLVDYVRAYEYPRDDDPQVKFTAVPEKSTVKTGEKFTFTVDAKPSPKSGSPVETVYLFDNGYLLSYKTQPPYHFELAIDREHYANTAWDAADRSGKKQIMDGYTHFFRVVVQDAAGKVAYTEPFPMIADMTGGQPYQAEIPTVPGKITPGHFNTGGQNIGSYKVIRKPLAVTGTDKLLSRKKLGLREAGEWVNYIVEAKESGTCKIVLNRQEYRREWPMTAMLLIDGKYVGNLNAAPAESAATLDRVQLSSGKHLVTLIGACTYGIWPDSIEFIK